LDRLEVQSSGFTLLELLVVLVLIGVASSFVGPQLWQTYVKNQERSVVQSFANSFQKLRIASRREGRSIRLPSLADSGYSEKEFPMLPRGWRIVKAPVLVFLPTGVTNGGKLMIQSDSGHRWSLWLKPLVGKVEIERQ